jgi:tRNA U34 5-methylaminomethyl-2-thiouridine-forming methyltransferase MnmC
MDFQSDLLQERISLVTTSDGSQTLAVDGGLEHYHSTNGAIEEAMHVYIGAGLAKVVGPKVAVFEMGFGTGLNAMLAYIYAVNNGVEVRYLTLERYPLSSNITLKLSYPSILGVDRQKFFDSLHSASWNEWHQLDPLFFFKKVEYNMGNYALSDSVDVVFYDAFSPDLQPNLWSVDVFKNIYSALSVGGSLVTYSSKGFVKNNLREAGFIVKRLPGPKGKRHMVLAQK